MQRDGKLVTAEDVERARLEGASDVEIHDTVLIAAAFCMYNRYVDGLDTWQPHDAGMYDADGPAPGRAWLSEIVAKIARISSFPVPEAMPPLALGEFALDFAHKALADYGETPPKD